MMRDIYREITTLSDKDYFMIYSRIKNFTFPLHIHPEYELNFIENGTGVQRVVGDSVENIEELELTLIAKSNIEHGWFRNECKSKKVREITIQFHPDLFNSQLLQKNQFHTVNEMFGKAVNGITFSNDTILTVKDKLYSLTDATQNGYQNGYAVLKLFEIFYDLSLGSMRELSSRSFHGDGDYDFNSRRIKDVYDYILKNYNRDIGLTDAAQLVGMTENALTRFLKQKTGRNFIDALNEIRIGYASRMLLDTTHSIAEVCYECGFNNISNFNRIFKSKKNTTPTDFRKTYRNMKRFF